jgi:tRNA 2-thiocytidine biosynthesis protein TtcA
MITKQPMDRWIVKTVGQTIKDYDLIHENDRIAVAVSGGKDSWSLLHLLLHFQQVCPFRFEVIPVTIDPGFDEFPVSAIESTYKEFDIPYHIEAARIKETISGHLTPGKSACSFCARLRRGSLYQFAETHQCNKIALGHHADDAIETLFITGFFQGTLVSLPPRLNVSNHDILLIRPLIRVFENDLRKYCQALGIKAFGCSHHSYSAGGRRSEVKQWLAFMSRRNPRIKKNLLAALQRVNTNHFLDSRWL